MMRRFGAIMTGDMSWAHAGGQEMQGLQKGILKYKEGEWRQMVQLCVPRHYLHHVAAVDRCVLHT